MPAPDSIACALGSSHLGFARFPPAHLSAHAGAVWSSAPYHLAPLHETTRLGFFPTPTTHGLGSGLLCCLQLEYVGWREKVCAPSGPVPRSRQRNGDWEGWRNTRSSPLTMGYCPQCSLGIPRPPSAPLGVERPDHHPQPRPSAPMMHSPMPPLPNVTGRRLDPWLVMLTSRGARASVNVCLRIHPERS